MYMVISKWKPMPGRETEFEEIGRNMRATLRSQPGVVLIEGIEGPDAYHVVHVYEDEAAYSRVVDDPQSVFNQQAQQLGIENVAEWLSSVKGVTRS
jgi:heme-degrading monooxygenase HmoA